MPRGQDKNISIREESPLKIKEDLVYSFSVLHSQKKRRFFVNSEAELKQWIEALIKALGKRKLQEEYRLEEPIGHGKFSIVMSGTNIKTGEKVAIKVITKKRMTQSELEMQRTEIEVLKIAQHPNIIKLIDIFENMEHLHLVLEFMPGGDLFDY